MSLSSLLEKTDVKEYLKGTLKRPHASRPREIVAPPKTSNYQHMGIAFDYALRWKFQYLHPRPIVPARWTADAAVPLISDPATKESAKRVLSRARRRLKSFLATGDVTEEMLISALEVARLDPVFRAGRGFEHIGANEDPLDVEDLRGLLDVVPSSLLDKKRVCILNPVFNESALVGGADADMVLGNLLLDLKVTHDSKVYRSYFNQLIGYYLLFRLGGLAGLQRQPSIRRIGVYMARFGSVVSWNLEEIGSERQFAEAERWLRTCATELHGGAS